MTGGAMAATQQATIDAVYQARGAYRRYAANFLYPAEAACLLKYQPRFCGRDVLDIGVGAGRTTHYLAPLARRYEAIDYSPVMVAYLKRAMPGVSAREADFRDLRMFDADAFDCAFASDNVIDLFSHQDRLRAMSEVRRVLRPGGIIAFCAHNLRYGRAFSGPRLEWSSNPASLASNCAKFLAGAWNHLRVARLRLIAEEYALLNDQGHFYACLHYYASRKTVTAQLEKSGLRVIDVFDRAGHSLEEGEDDSHTPHLMYVAERQPGRLSCIDDQRAQ